MKQNIFLKRIKRLKSQLDKQPSSAALLVSSASSSVRSRDDSHPYRQSSDFYYLTGSLASNLILLLSSSNEKPLLFVPPLDKKQVLWEGSPPSYKKLAQSLNAELVSIENPEKSLPSYLRGVDCLFFQNEIDTLAWKITQKLFSLPSHARGTLPKRFAHSDILIEPMRLYKESEEILLITKAAQATNLSLHAILPILQPGFSEKQIAASIDHLFYMQDCEPAFTTIVASGASAATLHHSSTSRLLKNSDMVLIDFGARYQMYASDITRTLPVSGKFSPIQKEIYAAVLQAQKAAISKIKHGVLVEDVYNAAASVLCQALKDFKILKGPLKSLMSKHAYQGYFPHSIGHSLGIDVHDIGALRSSQKARLEAGMVFTVEPGLYFPKAIGKVPACGVRIEDDVLVTKKGALVLSEGFPKEIDEIEALF